jgi:hypothetical protein
MFSLELFKHEHNMTVHTQKMYPIEQGEGAERVAFIFQDPIPSQVCFFLSPFLLFTLLLVHSKF